VPPLDQGTLAVEVLHTKKKRSIAFNRHFLSVTAPLTMSYISFTQCALYLQPKNQNPNPILSPKHLLPPQLARFCRCHRTLLLLHQATLSF
jgi:hypothetical protein